MHQFITLHAHTRSFTMPASQFPAGVTIRHNRPDDQAAVRALHDRTSPAGSSSPSPQPWPADLDHINDLYLAFWVAVDEAGRVVGMVGARAPTVDVTSEVLRGRDHILRLVRMRVGPEYQRQGIGPALTEAVIGWARGAGFRTLILETTTEQLPAIALYHRLGFVETGRSRLGRFELVWFERDLTSAF